MYESIFSFFFFQETYYIPPKSESTLQTHPKGKIVKGIQNQKLRARLLAEQEDARPAQKKGSGSVNKSNLTLILG